MPVAPVPEVPPVPLGEPPLALTPPEFGALVPELAEPPEDALCEAEALEEPVAVEDVFVVVALAGVVPPLPAALAVAPPGIVSDGGGEVLLLLAEGDPPPQPPSAAARAAQEPARASR